ncbi:hypothetical protein COT97_05870 [Candidatus Falkowbacteria bacterium CG10_big_fil_rev_8_21_14_0_10_39_11]|uniref:Uncharacterized protein n=1 Tax=Candidatus Falkowbacteria bacterium CG10_big_fil_rev_8_21_14_0_10_39_11 TaxID=1974565 RepID=A0A2H0V3B5_9BACT|nr:MAG: hypothetical protein COT97_05870 [Candidatus Falkowbacteria bacterium CG10_big_fil_rev_8_21_14_0_10_39_11]
MKTQFNQKLKNINTSIRSTITEVKENNNKYIAQKPGVISTYVLLFFVVVTWIGLLLFIWLPFRDPDLLGLGLFIGIMFLIAFLLLFYSGYSRLKHLNHPDQYYLLFVPEALIERRGGQVNIIAKEDLVRAQNDTIWNVETLLYTTIPVVVYKLKNNEAKHLLADEFDPKIVGQINKFYNLKQNI